MISLIRSQQSVDSYNVRSKDRNGCSFGQQRENRGTIGVANPLGNPDIVTGDKGEYATTATSPLQHCLMTAFL